MKLPKRLERTTIYESDWVNLYTDKVEMPTGQIIEKYHQLSLPFESVVVLPFNDEGQVCMIKSLRYSTQKVEWELPAGRIDKGENIMSTAIREVREETGLRLMSTRWIQSFNPSNGMSDEVINIVTGEIDYSMEQTELDLDEVASIHWKTKKEVEKLITGKKVNDGISMIPLLMWVGGLV